MDESISSNYDDLSYDPLVSSVVRVYYPHLLKVARDLRLVTAG